MSTKFGADAPERVIGRDIAIGLVLALVLGIWCYAPALHAYFAQDDFAFLAMARLLHQPWLLFVRDHFPGSLYFRPLGVLVWWLACAFSGAAAWPQYAVNLVLHLGCVAALYALLQRLQRDAWINACWAALFAVHPLALGTGLWLSDRFDLLTTLFSLLALSAALAHVARPTAASLTALLLWILLGLASKELGVVAAAAVCATLAFAPRSALSLRQRGGAIAAVVAITFAWLAYRHAMLTPIGAPNFAGFAPAVFAQGGWNWLRTFADFLGADPRMPRWGWVTLVCAASFFAAAVVLARRVPRERRSRWHLILGFATLAILPGLVQAPVAAKHLGGIDAQTAGFAMIVASRFFHLALTGLIGLLAFAAAPAAAANVHSTTAKRMLAASLLLALSALAPVAQRVAHAHASDTRRQIASMRATEDVLEHAALPAHACQIYFLQTAMLPAFAGYSDALAKGLAPAPERIAHCLVSTERPPYTYFVRTGSQQPSDYAPLQPLMFAGKAVPWVVVGDLQAMYLTMGPGFAAALPPQALVFEYRDGVFVDVSAAVRSGERKIDFAMSGP